MLFRGKDSKETKLRNTLQERWQEINGILEETSELSDWLHRMEETHEDAQTLVQQYHQLVERWNNSALLLNLFTEQEFYHHAMMQSVLHHESAEKSAAMADTAREWYQSVEAEHAEKLRGIDVETLLQICSEKMDDYAIEIRHIADMMEGLKSTLRDAYEDTDLSDEEREERISVFRQAL